MKNLNLYTVTTNSFIEKDILSDKSTEELENEFYKVSSKGSVEVVEENEEKVIFKQRGNLLSLPIERVV